MSDLRAGNFSAAEERKEIKRLQNEHSRMEFSFNFKIYFD